jgi:hypothetical protein
MTPTAVRLTVGQWCSSERCRWYRPLSELVKFPLDRREIIRTLFLFFACVAFGGW